MKRVYTYQFTAIVDEFTDKKAWKVAQVENKAKLRSR